MAATHGLFWVWLRPYWTYAVSNTGVFFCYILFLFSFGMSIAILCLRGTLDTLSGRMRTLRRAGIVLLAYYAIVTGHYLVSAINGGGARDIAQKLVGYLVLFNVPKAGDFIVSFILFQLIAVALGRRLRSFMEHPWLLIGVALLCQRVSMSLYAVPVSTVILPYWRLFFGSEHISRSFPIMGYMPLFVASLLLGKSYLSALDRLLWLRRAFQISLMTAALTLPGDWYYFQSGNGLLGMLDPVPTLFFLVQGGAMTAALFSLIGLYCQRETFTTKSPLTTFLIYVGQNSIWTIVWQYTWIQMILRVFPIPPHSSLPIPPYIAAVVLLPPASLYLAQRLWRSRRKMQDAP